MANGKAKAVPTKELAKVPETALAVDPKSKGKYYPIPINLQLEGDTDDSVEPILLNNKKIMNAVSPPITEGVPGAKQGEFFDSLNSTSKKSIVAIPLFHYLEKYCTKDAVMGSPMVCSSRDGAGKYGMFQVEPSMMGIPVINLSSNGQTISVGDCNHCPNCLFTSDNSNKRTKPLCRDVHFLVCIDEEDFSNIDMTSLASGDVEALSSLVSTLFVIQFAGSNINEYKKLKNMSRLGGGAWFARYWTFGTTQKPGPTGKYWGITVNPSGGLTPEQIISARSLSKFIEQLRGYDRLRAELSHAEISSNELETPVGID